MEARRCLVKPTAIDEVHHLPARRAVSNGGAEFICLRNLGRLGLPGTCFA
jgi:hypothetical protein